VTGDEVGLLWGRFYWQ